MASYPQLAVRPCRGNPDHHIWANHGTYWLHCTVYPTPFTAERVRRSLRTKDLDEARCRRDELLAGEAQRLLFDLPRTRREHACT